MRIFGLVKTRHVSVSWDNKLLLLHSKQPSIFLIALNIPRFQFINMVFNEMFANELKTSTIKYIHRRDEPNTGKIIWADIYVQWLFVLNGYIYFWIPNIYLRFSMVRSDITKLLKQYPSIYTHQWPVILITSIVTWSIVPLIIEYIS